MQPFDEALDSIEHARAQRVLDRALIAGLTADQIRDYKRTRRILWQRITRQADYDLAYALQIVARIGEIWDLLGNRDGGWHRHNHDEEAYQGYRHLLLRGLNQPESTALHALAGDLLPHILPRKVTNGARIAWSPCGLHWIMRFDAYMCAFWTGYCRCRLAVYGPV